MKIKINFSDFWEGVDVKKVETLPFYSTLSARFDLEISDNPDFLIYSCYGKDYLNYDCVRVFYTGENIRPDFTECDYAFSFDYPVTNRNFRFPLCKFFIQSDLQFAGKLREKKNVPEIIKQKSKFCNFIYSREVSLRNDFFKLLSEYKKVDAPGICMNNMPPIGSYDSPNNSRCSSSWEDEKLKFMTPYKFTIAFENASYPGYTTEKIVDPMSVGSIPVYWGNPLVHKDFNPKSFINCNDYKSLEDVVARIIEVDNDDELYARYLEEPYELEGQFLKEADILDRFEVVFSKKKPLVARRVSSGIKRLGSFLGSGNSSS